MLAASHSAEGKHRARRPGLRKGNPGLRNLQSGAGARIRCRRRIECNIQSSITPDASSNMKSNPPSAAHHARHSSSSTPARPQSAGLRSTRTGVRVHSHMTPAQSWRT